MKILMVGSGGREHALIRKLKESPKVNEVICAPGNGGISFDASCFPVDASDINGMIELARQQSVDIVFVAPDNPLAAGMVDAMEGAGIKAFGPHKSAAEIESSKVFSKNLMKKYNIPTATYEVFDTPETALEFIRVQNVYPTVIKADGLALGKGVVIAETYRKATDAINSIMKDKVFGDSGSKVVVEEFLTGPEVSVLAFTDSKTMVPMVSSMDHKRAYDGDTGPNTGGMGTISPNPYYDKNTAEYCMNNIFIPTMEAMNAEGRPFKGCLYFGLMLTPSGPRVIEYNARFGDPETQVIMPRLKTPLIDIIKAVILERLSEIHIKWDDNACACVIIASGGYPGNYQKNLPIYGLNQNGQFNGVSVYHSGTKATENGFVTNGGRVLGITAVGANTKEALKKAYSAVNNIKFESSFFRTDIGSV